MLKTKLSTTLVYSTETGRICPDCSQPVALDTAANTLKASYSLHIQ
jgi:hypothetical protein